MSVGSVPAAQGKEDAAASPSCVNIPEKNKIINQV